MENVQVKIKKLHEDAIIPSYAKEGDAGFDLYTLKEVEIYPHQTVVIPTGIAMEIPKGYEVQVRPRSGISLKGVECKSKSYVFTGEEDADGYRSEKVYLRVQLGTIDSGYRNDVGIIVYNQSNEKVKLSKHVKLAQGVLNQVPTADFIEVDELSDSERGINGFGHSGV